MKDWIEPYYETRKNKRRSKDSVSFEIHFERNLLRMKSELENQTYTPSTYAFMAHRPRKREVFACDMSLRIIDTRLAMKMNPLIEKRLTKRTFNNRIGYGNVKAINSLISDIYEVTHGYTKDAWVIKIDMRGFFPNAIHQIAYEKMSEILESDYKGPDKDALRYLLRVSMFTSATERCRRISPAAEWEDYPAYKSLFVKPAGVGGIIGRERWQTAMNLYLNDMDHIAVDEWGWHWNRFVDDIAIVTDNKEMTLQMIPQIRAELQKVGVRMHPKKFYCQHYSRGVEFIGATIKGRRVYANNKTLNNAKCAILKHNRRVGEKYIDGFIASINSYFGIFKGRNEYKNIRRLVERVDKGWFKYCFYDEKRVSFKAKDEYNHRRLLEYKYNIKLRKNGNKRKSRGTGVRKTGMCKDNEEK